MLLDRMVLTICAAEVMFEAVSCSGLEVRICVLLASCCASTAPSETVTWSEDMERHKIHRFGGKHTNRKVEDLQTTNHNLSYSHWLEYSQGLIHIQFFQWSQILGFHCCTSTWLRLWKYQLYGVEGEEGRGHINMFDLPKWHELTEHVTNPCQEIYIQLVVPGRHICEE